MPRPARRHVLGTCALVGSLQLPHSGEWRNGRRAGFRCQCSKGRGGSSPPSPTGRPQLSWGLFASREGVFYRTSTGGNQNGSDAEFGSYPLSPRSSSGSTRGWRIHSGLSLSRITWHGSILLKGRSLHRTRRFSFDVRIRYNLLDGGGNHYSQWAVALNTNYWWGFWDTNSSSNGAACQSGGTCSSTWTNSGY